MGYQWKALDILHQLIRHDESYRDTSVSPGAKNPPFSFLKTNDLPDSICYTVLLPKKINAKSHQIKKLQLFLVACYATLHPALSIHPSVGLSVTFYFLLHFIPFKSF